MDLSGHGLVTLGTTFGMIWLAAQDARTGRVNVLRAKILSFYTFGATLTYSAAVSQLGLLIPAIWGSILVTALQFIPSLARQRLAVPTIGRADIRLAMPYGWALGWLGGCMVFVGFGASLAAGLAYAAVAGTNRVPFVPFMAGGLVLAHTLYFTTTCECLYGFVGVPLTAM